jgi:opacity protein-like surface antigen
MRMLIAIATGLAALGSVAAVAHTVDQRAPGVTWNLYVDGDQAKLAYGQPNSDLVGIMMACNRGDGAVTVSGDVDPAKPELVLASGEKQTALTGPASSDPFGGGLYMEARASTHDAALARFAKTGDLTVRHGQDATEMRASFKARGDIRRFFAHCEA